MSDTYPRTKAWRLPTAATAATGNGAIGQTSGGGRFATYRRTTRFGDWANWLLHQCRNQRRIQALRPRSFSGTSRHAFWQCLLMIFQFHRKNPDECSALSCTMFAGCNYNLGIDRECAHEYYCRGGSGGQSMCTVGLMLSGCTVDDTLPGSPSFACGTIKKGDYITEVCKQLHMLMHASLHFDGCVFIGHRCRNKRMEKTLSFLMPSIPGRWMVRLSRRITSSMRYAESMLLEV
jgi:hypothetical protein